MANSDSVASGAVDFRLLRERLERAVARHGHLSAGPQRDDVVQAAMLRMMNVIQKAGSSAAFSEGYLMRTLYTVTIDEIRAANRRAEVPLAEAGAVEPRAGSADPEKEQLARELGREILDCMGRLARPRRVAVSLYLLGNSGPESGRALGWSAKRVNNLVYRGLADLRRCLESKGVTP